MGVSFDYNNHEYANPESFWNFKGKLDFVDNWFLMGSPVPLAAIMTAYILFVLQLGPNFMKKRTAYSLTNILLVYNLAQVILSIYIFYVAMTMMMSLGLLHKTCNMETEESRRQIASINYIYFICKVTELLDTVFFVLRKKQNQVSFLHVYHHFLMVCATWMLLKYEPGYSLLFTGTVNSLVHIIMYLYYGLSAFPGMTKYLWWKKYITKLQLTQFCLVLIHFLANSATSQCKVSKILTVTVMFNLILFMYLFFKFYVESYSKNDTKSKKETSGIKPVPDKFKGETVNWRTNDTTAIKSKTNYNDSKHHNKNDVNKRYVTKNRPVGESCQTR